MRRRVTPDRVAAVIIVATCIAMLTVLACWAAVNRG